MRMQVILDSPFASSGSAPIGGGKKGEWDWTSFQPIRHEYAVFSFEFTKVCLRCLRHDLSAHVE